jgi:putative CocE/NonD family hydrolase
MRPILLDARLGSALADYTAFMLPRTPSRVCSWRAAMATLLVISSTALPIASHAAFARQQDAAEPFDVRAHYIKTEHMIPMRDGARLFTAVYSPRHPVSAPYPILMLRTPYSCSPYGEENYRDSVGPSDHFMRGADWIIVYQDVRGCYLSEGEFVNMTPHVPIKRTEFDVDESSDAYDSIEWLLANVPNNNGRVGMWGISYPGFYAAASMIDAHPALQAVSPQAPIADWWYDDFHHHGAFFLPHAFRFLSAFGHPRPAPTTQRPGRSFEFWTPDGYEFYLDMGPIANANEKYLKNEIPFWNEIIDHPNYDEFWQARNILPHLHDTAPASMIVGGWFDAEDLYGPLQIYREVEKNNPGVFNILVMGPWRHGGWARTDGDRLGHIHFGTKTSLHYREHIEYAFFNHHLKDALAPVLAEAIVFDTGALAWREFDEWPPKAARESFLYLRESGGLAFDPPDAKEIVFDEYISDPAKPVPFTEDVAQGMTQEYMTDDQRFASRRPDVLTYRTDVLSEPITLAGPVVAELWVSTSGSDSDWIVKLIDVFPPDAPDTEATGERMHMGSYQMTVRSEVMRGRFRNDPASPEPFDPGVPTKVTLPLQDVMHTFKPGHRIMIQIQSTWFPLVDRNPQTFVPNIYLAEEKDFVKAVQRVYRSREQATRIRFGTVGAGISGAE